MENTQKNNVGQNKYLCEYCFVYPKAFLNSILKIKAERQNKYLCESNGNSPLLKGDANAVILSRQDDNIVMVHTNPIITQNNNVGERGDRWKTKKSK